MADTTWADFLAYPGLRDADVELRQRDTALAARLASAKMIDGLVVLNLQDLRFTRGGEAYIQGCSVTGLALTIEPFLVILRWCRGSRWEFDLPVFQYCVITPKSEPVAVPSDPAATTSKLAT
jgi:hypothetical protein